MKKPVRKTYLKITTAQWVDAIKILTGEIKGSRVLKMNLQQQLKKQLRGSFLTREEAVKVIDQMNWRISNDT